VISNDQEMMGDVNLMRMALESPVSSQLASTDIQRLSPAALAYLGDAVYELFVRRFCLMPPKRIDAYHHQVVAQVRAETQAEHLRSLIPHLSEPEQEILRRGRNAASNRPKRLDPEIYQQATSFEALMGYLYLTNPQRLLELLSYLDLKQ
jgi:ribonuclease III family protein